MGLVVMRNNMEADGPVDVPVHDDGSGYRYCMYFHNFFDIAFADSEEELLDALIPGYVDLDDTTQAEQRILLGVAAANQVQAAILADVDLSTLSDSEVETLMAPRIAPSVRADWWSSDVPLVVVETAYQPWADVPRPASAISDTADAPNLLWVRPVEPEDFLRSLHEIGYIRLMEATN